MKTLVLFLLLPAYGALTAQTGNFGIFAQLSTPPGDFADGNQFFTTAPTTNTTQHALSYALLAEYRLGEAKVRLRAGIEKLGTKYQRTLIDNNGITETTTTTSDTYKQDRVMLAPGFTWTITEKDRVSLETGFEVPFRIFSDYTRSNTLSVRTTSLAQTEVTFQGSEESRTIVPLGYSVGIGAILKFNFRLAGGFTLGAEAVPSLTYVNHQVENGRIEQYNNGNLTSSNPYNGTYERTFFQENRFSINLGYQF